jgi:signal transduction histidine kinase
MDFQRSAVNLGVDGSVNDSILRMLHRTAQPLTVIRGILEMTLTETMTAEEKKAWLEQAVEQITQASARFDQLRKTMEVQAGLHSEVRAIHV